MIPKIRLTRTKDYVLERRVKNVMNYCLKQKFHRYFLLILTIGIVNSFCEAKKVPGYIVTDNADTLYGEVRINLYNNITQGIIISGIDMEYLHHEVSFKEYEGGKFIVYTPEMISGFGFIFESAEYIFHRYTIETKSILKKNKVECRFLNLIYEHKISLYRDNFHVQYWVSISNEHPVYLDYDLYLFNAKLGLKKAEKSRKTPTVQKLLRLYEFEEEFIKELPEKTKFNDIRYVLESYFLWLAKEKSKKTEI